MASEGVDHPTRQRILATMVAGEPVDPAQISRWLGEPLSQASYHLRVLAQRGEIATLQEEPTNGAYILTREVERAG
jgi:DNA-binding transcriptional ArsR family regulator